MTYHEITTKLKDLTMTPSDWSWLDNYCKSKSGTYHALVEAYQAREASELPVCDTEFGLCRFCGYEFKCGYKGFCGHQRKASQTM